MTDIEKILNSKYEDKGAYKIPEGYFASLNKRILDSVASNQVNAQESTREKGKLKRFFTVPLIKRYAAAACLIGLIVTVGYKLSSPTSNDNDKSLISSHQETYSEQYVNDCLTYAMIDNDDVYLYLEE